MKEFLSIESQAIHPRRGKHSQPLSSQNHHRNTSNIPRPKTQCPEPRPLFCFRNDISNTIHQSSDCIKSHGPIQSWGMYTSMQSQKLQNHQSAHHSLNNTLFPKSNLTPHCQKKDKRRTHTTSNEQSIPFHTILMRALPPLHSIQLPSS